MTRHITLPLKGIGCSVPAQRVVIERLYAIGGVLAAAVNPVTEMAYVQYDPTRCTEKDLVVAVWSTGYGDVQPAGTPAPPAPAVGGRSAEQAFALAAGFWLATVFAICLAFRAAFPQADRAFSFWEAVLPGVTGVTLASVIVGAVESFALGFGGAWLFIVTFQALAPRRDAHAGTAPAASASSNATPP